jgi:hypothetical protein
MSKSRKVWGTPEGKVTLTLWDGRSMVITEAEWGIAYQTWMDTTTQSHRATYTDSEVVEVIYDIIIAQSFTLMYSDQEGFKDYGIP